MTRTAVGGLAALAVAAGAAWLARAPAAAPATAPGVVSVLAPGPGTATGFVVSGGRVVTVAHVLDSARPVSLRGSGGTRAHARVLRIDRRSDLALLAVDGRIEPITAPPQRRTRLVTAAGLLPATVRREIDATVRNTGAGRVYARPALELAASVQAGDSGAPLVGADGRLLGVLFARSDRRARTAYAVDGAAVSRLLAGG